MAKNTEDAPYLWRYRGVATQANAAGGAVIIDISPGAGNYLELIDAFVSNSGTNSVNVAVRDSSNNTVSIHATVASGAATATYLPSIGANAASSGAIASSVGLKVFGADKLSLYQAGAGAQNDTLTVNIRAFVRSDTAPTVSKARSTNQADVTIVETYNTVTVA